MKLSIVIPVLDSHEVLRRQLLHFDRMKLRRDTEIIIVDDGSDPPLEEIAYQLYRDLCKLRPAQYAARQYDQDDEAETQSDLCSYWNGAVEAVRDGWEALEELLELLEERAGLPYRTLYLQRARSRGLLEMPLGQSVEESVASGEDKGPEYAKGAAT